VTTVGHETVLDQLNAVTLADIERVRQTYLQRRNRQLSVGTNRKKMGTQTELIEDLNTLNQIAVVLNRAVDVRSALNETLPRLIKLMGLETGWVFVHDESDESKWCGRGYTLAAHYNLPPAMNPENPDAWYKGCDCQGLCNRGQFSKPIMRCNAAAWPS
jgi:hypothetical protein